MSHTSRFFSLQAPRKFLTAALSALLLSQAAPSLAAENYADRPEVARFVDDLVTRHGFDRAELLDLFRRAEFQAGAIKFILPPASPTVRNWTAYRARYIEPKRVNGGLAFWAEHKASLDRASREYGVPQEIIVAILGVETLYGRIMGKFQTFSTLTTLAFDYPPRAELFRGELEQLLLLARESHSSPLIWRGSFAGALGMPQFLPSSIRKWAVDFDNDGRIDLAGSPDDAIGSVAKFLHDHGWQAGTPVAQPAILSGDAYRELADGKVAPRWTPAELAAKGIAAQGGSPDSPNAKDDKSALIDLITPGGNTEYWLGYQNFYVITRYNRSSFYAMVVFHLAQELKKQGNGG